LPRQGAHAAAGQPDAGRGRRDGGGAAAAGGHAVPGGRGLGAPQDGHDAAAARDLAGRIHLLGDAGTTPPVPRMVADALSARRVLRIGYGDREGAATMREIEPLGYVGTATHWYLVAWCRLRDALRAFRTDRITSVSVTAEVPALRSLRREDLDIPLGIVCQLTLS
jgi:hypothetical protein